jgi:hypothetical protein
MTRNGQRGRGMDWFNPDTDASPWTQDQMREASRLLTGVNLSLDNRGTANLSTARIWRLDAGGEVLGAGLAENRQHEFTVLTGQSLCAGERLVLKTGRDAPMRAVVVDSRHGARAHGGDESSDGPQRFFSRVALT